MAAKAWSRVRFNRKLMTLNDEQLLELFRPYCIAADATKLAVLKVVESGHGIQRGRLRPATLIKELAKIDSWTLDSGAEKLKNVLKKQHDIVLTPDAVSMALGDIIRMLK